eukprot:gene17502-biopygen5565
MDPTKWYIIATTPNRLWEGKVTMDIMSWFMDKGFGLFFCQSGHFEIPRDNKFLEAKLEEAAFQDRAARYQTGIASKWGVRRKAAGGRRYSRFPPLGMKFGRVQTPSHHESADEEAGAKGPFEESEGPEGPWRMRVPRGRGAPACSRLRVPRGRGAPACSRLHVPRGRARRHAGVLACPAAAGRWSAGACACPAAAGRRPAGACAGPAAAGRCDVSGAEVAPVTSQHAPSGAEVAPVTSQHAPSGAEVAPVTSQHAPSGAEVAPVTTQHKPSGAE